MAFHAIRVSGCDDQTQFEMDLDSAALEIVAGLVERCNDASDGGCQPTMLLIEGSVSDDDDR